MKFSDREIKLVIFNSTGTLVSKKSEHFDQEIRYPTKSMFEELVTRETKIAFIVNEEDIYEWLKTEPEMQYVDDLYLLNTDDSYEKAYLSILNELNVSKEETLIICQNISHYKYIKELGYFVVGLYDYSICENESLNEKNCEDYLGDLYDIRYKIIEENELPIFEIDNYKVKKFIDGYEILGIVNHVDDLLIPAYLEGKKVYRVGKEAFMGLTFKTITLEEGIRDIDSCAFNKVKGVKELVIPKSIIDMSLYSFSSSEWEKITFLGYVPHTFCSFEGLDYVKEINFPSEWKYIDFRCFWCSDGIEELYLPEGLEWIGMQAFNNCVNLKIIHLPKSLNRISGDAFYRCHSLKTVYYNGSKEDREKIMITNDEGGNDKLIEAEWIYNE